MSKSSTALFDDFSFKISGCGRVDDTDSCLTDGNGGGGRGKIRIVK